MNAGWCVFLGFVAMVAGAAWFDAHSETVAQQAEDAANTFVSPTSSVAHATDRTGEHLSSTSSREGRITLGSAIGTE